MRAINPFLAVDGYKIFHHLMSPEGTSLIYSNFTPRAVKYAPKGCEEILVFGTQMTIREIVNNFEENFFQNNEIERITPQYADRNEAKEIIKFQVCREIKEEYDMYSNTDYDVSKIEALFDLGYLPIKVKGIPEGEFVKPGIPVMTIYNTHPDFAWVTNFLETMISNLLWKPMTSATMAYEFKKLNDKWIAKTDPGNDFHADFGCHDFSMRGMDSLYATMSSGLGHALSFKGSDSLPVIHGAREYYDAKGFVVGSIPATEHSIQCAYYHNSGSDYEYVKTLIERFPTGPLGLVSDGFDLWKLLTEVLPKLKEQIMAREGGPVVFRPDSGDPVDIMCGNAYPIVNKDKGENTWDATRGIICHNRSEGENYYINIEDNVYQVYGKHMLDMIDDYGWENGISDSFSSLKSAIRNGFIERAAAIGNTPADKGIVELLWDIFGGTVNAQGFKVLHPSVRVIYGDAINLERFNEINERLAAKGFASTNWVAGVGSFTYQFNTRDTFGFAMKSTYQEVSTCLLGDYCFTNCRNGCDPNIKGINILKDPITDDGTKKSAKGLLMVEDVGAESSEYVLYDERTWDDEDRGALQTIFEDGKFKNVLTLDNIRDKVVSR